MNDKFTDKRNNNQNFDNIDEEDPIQLINESLPICTEELIQHTVPFWVMENILVNDIITFKSIWKQYNSQSVLISNKESEDIELAMHKFENDKNPGIIVTEQGIIYDINSQFSQTHGWSREILSSGIGFCDIIR